MDDMVRGTAPGAFANLSDGHTHYQWHGPDDGPVLVCVHGLTTPSYVWEPLLPGLTEAGFRVLTYDLYGRGFSDRPRGAQTRSFFIRQMRDLLADQGVADGFTLMGYSMGGSIAAVFTAEEPQRAQRLILLAPAGMVHSPSRVADFARRTPVLGDWVMLAFGGRELRQIAKQMPAPQSIRNRLGAETDWRGYLPAVLSSQRDLLAEELEEEHRAIAQAQIPVSAIWGALDTVIPPAAIGKLTEWNRNTHQISVPDADHALVMSHPDEVLAAMAETLG
ncbi:Alpha/beta hydrolase fold precursor [Candidatus Rhodobacter oscarellae]|uniref:Alpha/beta hydrolase fold n=2 Tax=Candidatus Rhodobacter oscarellae TaxID=1675527 RepID=A0A0J9E883_9RHOB|nr:Alpha/beta hydrolase fold precursor [Candidatus Rhodobacter lobularis]